MKQTNQMRQKKPLESTVTKYIDFLQEIHTFAIPNEVLYITLKDRIEKAKINKSILIALSELGIIEILANPLWNWIGKEPNRELALEVLNFLLEMNKKQIVTPITGLDEETKGYIKAIHDVLIHNVSKQNNSLDGLKTPILSKAINQVEQAHLFTEVESNESKKFELLKAVATGAYSCQGISEIAITDLIHMNNDIVQATEDLFNKFFSKK